jgi:hypothetical protein
MTVIGTQDQQQAFLLDALRLSPQWAWDRVKIDFNGKASLANDGVGLLLDSYTRGLPTGLDAKEGAEEGGDG